MRLQRSPRARDETRRELVAAEFRAMLQRSPRARDETVRYDPIIRGATALQRSPRARDETHQDFKRELHVAACFNVARVRGMRPGQVANGGGI